MANGKIGIVVPTFTPGWRDRFKIHPACIKLPQVGKTELELLAADIAASGLLEKVKLWKDATGTVWLIDGRSRADAEQMNGVLLDPDKHCEFIAAADDEAVANYVVSENIRRRMLTARQRVELAIAILGGPPQQRVDGRRLVSRVAKAAGVSKPTVYENRDLLPEGAARTQGEIGSAVRELLAHPEKLPPPLPRKNNHGGKAKTLEGRIADHLGVATATVRAHAGNGTVHRHVSNFNPSFSPSSNGRRRSPAPLPQLAENDLFLLRACRELSHVIGTDITAIGVKYLAEVKIQVARIGNEHRTGNVEILDRPAEVDAAYGARGGRTA